MNNELFSTKINYIIILFCIYLCCGFLCSCVSSRVYDNGATTDELRGELSELKEQQSATSITAQKLDSGLSDIERTAQEGARYLDEFEQILRRIRQQVKD